MRSETRLQERAHCVTFRRGRFSHSLFRPRASFISDFKIKHRLSLLRARCFRGIRASWLRNFSTNCDFRRDAASSCYFKLCRNSTSWSAAAPLRTRRRSASHKDWLARAVSGLRTAMQHILESALMTVTVVQELPFDCKFMGLAFYNLYFYLIRFLVFACICS